MLQVTRVARRVEDQLLLLASDGLWDVLSNQDACALALKVFQAELAKGSSSRSGVKKAASSLAKTALARGSRDNITVVVVDVRLSVPAAALSGAGQPSDQRPTERSSCTEANSLQEQSAMTDPEESGDGGATTAVSACQPCAE